MSEVLTLCRLTENRFGTFGVLIHNRNVVCHTFELPWRGNLKNVSCIPVGSYSCHRRLSSRFGCDVYELAGVPSRSDILIHPGNNSGDTCGCILPGTDVNDIGVVHSRVALERLFSRLPLGFTLDIRKV